MKNKFFQKIIKNLYEKEENFEKFSSKVKKIVLVRAWFENSVTD